MLCSGAKESINTSILADAPDVDIYTVGLAIGAPAVANGYAIDGLMGQLNSDIMRPRMLTHPGLSCSLTA